MPLLCFNSVVAERWIVHVIGKIPVIGAAAPKAGIVGSCLSMTLAMSFVCFCGIVDFFRLGRRLHRDECQRLRSRPLVQMGCLLLVDIF